MNGLVGINVLLSATAQYLLSLGNRSFFVWALAFFLCYGDLIFISHFHLLHDFFFSSCMVNIIFPFSLFSHSKFFFFFFLSFSLGFLCLERSSDCMCLNFTKHIYYGHCAFSNPRPYFTHTHTFHSYLVEMWTKKLR